MESIFYYILNQLSLIFILPTFIYLTLLLIRSANKIFFYVFLILIPVVYQVIAQNIIFTMELLHLSGKIAMDYHAYLNLGYVSYSFLFVFYLFFSISGTLLLSGKRWRIMFISTSILIGLIFSTSMSVMFDTETYIWAVRMRTAYIGFYSQPFTFSILAFLSNPKSRGECFNIQLLIWTIFLILLAVLDTIFYMQLPVFKLVVIGYIPVTVVFMRYLIKFFHHKYEVPINNEKINTFFNCYQISERERDLINLIIRGISNQDIADQLYISVNTVKTHIRNIYRKTSVSNRYQLISIINNME